MLFRYQKYRIISNFYASFSKNVFKLKIKVKHKNVCTAYYVKCKQTLYFGCSLVHGILFFGGKALKKTDSFSAREAKHNERNFAIRVMVTSSLTEISMDQLENRARIFQRLWSPGIDSKE
jgi:hypothetical protein